MKLAFWLLLIAATVTAGPRVTYLTDSAAAAGVTVLTANHVDFERSLAGLLSTDPRLAALAKVKRYLLIVQNHSPMPVTTIGVRREISYPARPPVVWIYTLERGDGTAVLEPGQSLVVFQGPDASMVDRLAAELEAATEVVVSLDVVIFASGLVVGPDRNGATVRLAAERQAVLDLLERLESAPERFDALKHELAAQPVRTLPLVHAQRDTTYAYRAKQRELAMFFSHARLDVRAAAEYLRAVASRMKPLYRSEP